MRIGRKNNMKSVWKNNKGYSIQELIVVIAIMAILVGGLTLSVSILIGWDAKECAEEIENHLNHVRTNALSKVSAEMRLTRDGVTDEYSVEYVEYNYQDDGSGGLIDVANTSKTFLLGKEKVTIECFFDDGTDMIISDVNSISVGFDRSSGAFTSVKINGTPHADVYCTSIEVSRAGTTYAINMIPKTGKIQVEKK